MIVADTNLIAYFLIKSAFTTEARAVYPKDEALIRKFKRTAISMRDFCS